MATEWKCQWLREWKCKGGGWSGFIPTLRKEREGWGTRRVLGTTLDPTLGAMKLRRRWGTRRNADSLREWQQIRWQRIRCHRIQWQQIQWQQIQWQQIRW